MALWDPSDTKGLWAHHGEVPCMQDRGRLKTILKEPLSTQ